jgi:NTP pyrophosphatase (non-canonical NTP hydrolase)
MILQLNQQEQLLFDDCVKLNTVSSQMRQYNEELGEAVVALAKYQRALEWGTPEEIEQTLKEWKGEMADNIIMQMQMAHIFGMDDVLEIVQRKLTRQQTRIDNKKKQLQNG